MTELRRPLLAACTAAAGLVLAAPAAPAAAGPDASGRSGAVVVDDEDEDTEQDFCGVEGLEVRVHEVVRIGSPSPTAAGLHCRTSSAPST
jgi:hypothetical protein